MKLIKTLLLIAAMLVLAEFVFAQTWTPTGLPSMEWSCFASSADGKTLVAEPFYPNGIIFVSTNGGDTWSTNTLPSFFPFGDGQPFNISFVSIASSADGTKLAGVHVGGLICTSTNSGTTWTTNNAPSASWYSIASSADGIKLTAVAGGGGNTIGPIYVSTNSGGTWLLTSAPSNHWRSVASSADGTKLLAASDNSTIPIIVSTNSGVTWAQISLPTNENWVVASSANGNKMAAAYYADWPNPGHVFTSTDSGNTWISNRLATGLWQALTMSADGNTIVLVSADSVVTVSTNFGANWTTNNIPGASGFVYYTSVASSADGGKILTGSTFTAMAFISQTVYQPQLKLTPSTTNLTLAWTIPSTNFILHQSSDLSAWADVTSAPVLNLTNLQNEVLLTPSNSSSFYRLKTP